MKNDSAKPGVEAALRLVVEGTASETGRPFFRTLVKNLAAALGTAGAGVTEYPQPPALRSIPMSGVLPLDRQGDLRVQGERAR